MTGRVAADEELWTAVGEPTRRVLLDRLLADGESTATRLAAGLPVTRQAVTKHLVVLDRAGLLESHRRGREVRYAVRPDRLDQATRSMSRVAADWDRRLRAIKRIAEQARTSNTT
jgi:ArsR family transcriptional regulator, cadmium/lead-responsive transcriptional repressor